MVLWGLATGSGTLFAQTNPAPQLLPYSQNFGTTSFNILPAGFVSWNGLSGGTVNTAALAAASAPSGDAAVTGVTTVQSTGGSYGYAAGSNGRFYVQTSSSTTNGVNQLALALDTRGFTDVTLSYDVEIISAQPRTVGVICQYRVGTSGAWTTLTPSTGLNPYSQSGGTAGVKTSPSIILPAAAYDKPVVQIRWATWRGTESGNSSGIGIDNISVSGAAITTTLSIVVSPQSIVENAGANAAQLTVTRTGNTGGALPVTLSINDTTEAAYDGPNPAQIPAGQTSANFSIRAVDDEVFDGTQVVTLGASAPGAVPVSTTLQVTDNEDAYSPPAGYYNGAAGKSGAELKAALRTISASGHQPYAYSDTLNPLRSLHQDPNNSANIITFYSGTSLSKNAVYFQGQNPDTTWSREHLWPASFGLDPQGVGGTGGDAGPDFTDLFNLVPALQTVNSQRGNRYFDETEGAGTTPPLAPQCSYDTDSWEPRPQEKGDVARAAFYMAVRYDGTDANTLDLELADTPNTTAGRFAKLATLLLWHQIDPPSQEERQRNQRIYAEFQRNRNPFIDHPEYVDLVFVERLSLPLFYGGPWTPTPFGFTAQGTETYTTSLGGDTNEGSVQFNHTGDRLTVAFNSAPGTVTFNLKGNPSSGSATEGTFLVQQSADGITYTTVRQIVNKNNTDQEFSDTLANGTRYVSFVYQTKTSGNLQFDKLSITAAATQWQSWLNSWGLTGANAEPNADVEGDFLTNLAEYALGTSPISPNPSGVTSWFETSIQKLRISAVVRRNDPALVVSAQTTTDLMSPGSWTSTGVTQVLFVDQTGVAAGFERVIFEADASSGNRFLRFVFTLK